MAGSEIDNVCELTWRVLTIFATLKSEGLHGTRRHGDIGHCCRINIALVVCSAVQRMPFAVLSLIH